MLVRFGSVNNVFLSLCVFLLFPTDSFPFFWLQAISVLNEVVKLAPNFPHLYHMLGLAHKALGDNKRAFQFYMLAGLLKPKDPDLWKLLFTWSL